MAREINLFHHEESKRLERDIKLKAKRIIEALLFASSEPVSFQKLREVMEAFHPMKPKVLKELIEDLEEEYISQQKAFRLEEVSLGYVLKTCEEYSPYIELLFRAKRAEKLSQAAAEVLAIIAYKQPVTRPEIDAIRGVDSSGTLQNLQERRLIESLGKLEVPGRPTLYGITDHFLTHFNLRNLKDLPSLDSVASTPLN